jgi:hypothetical protein
MPGKWEYQICPATGFDSSDHIWTSSYLLDRCAEEFGLSNSLGPMAAAGADTFTFHLEAMYDKDAYGKEI